MLRIVNLSHPLTPDQVSQVERLTGAPVTEVREVHAHFEPDDDLVPQARRILDDVGLTSSQWQAGGTIVNVPGHSVLAAAVLAAIHGASGSFPPVLRLRRTPIHATYEVVEIIDLQSARDDERARRST